MFSDSFSEGRERDINEGFPSDFHPYTDHYDYLSDSDLEDESFCSEEDDEEPLEGKDISQKRLEDMEDPKATQKSASDSALSVETMEAQNTGRLIPSTVEYFTVLVTPITDLTINSREWVKLPSSAIWEP